MDAAAYDAWYRSPRGRWIGEVEYRLLQRLLAPRSGEVLLDVGCGTGYFSRRFAQDGVTVTGIDSDAAMLKVARRERSAKECYIVADAQSLPFRKNAFDLCTSVTALCFIEEQSQALAEMLRVTRRRFAIGLLNRCSLLYLQKGRAGGKGAYRGAHWHTVAEVRRLFAPLSVARLVIRTAVFLSSESVFARSVEQWLPGSCPWGAFLVVAGDVLH